MHGMQEAMNRVWRSSCVSAGEACVLTWKLKERGEREEKKGKTKGRGGEVEGGGKREGMGGEGVGWAFRPHVSFWAYTCFRNFLLWQRWGPARETKISSSKATDSLHTHLPTSHCTQALLSSGATGWPQGNPLLSGSWGRCPQQQTGKPFLSTQPFSAMPKPEL